jgi:DNA-binding GntR family transcriptional regulator
MRTVADSQSPVPTRRVRTSLAEVVRAELRRAIVDGEFAVGAKLPNEDKLCERFGVSRVTVREAVRGLIEDGYVLRRHGSGTFVTRRPLLRNSLDVNFSYTEYLESAGVQAGKRVLSMQLIQADVDTATELGLEPGNELIEVRRIRTADGRPAIYSIDVLPAELADIERDQDALAASLYRLLTAAGRPVTHGEALVSPAIADASLSRLLEVPLHTPLQHLRQVDFDASGRAVMLSREWHVPSVIELSVYRRGPGPVH